MGVVAYIISFVVGGMFGCFLTCACVVAGRYDEQSERKLNEDKEPK